MNNVSDFAKAKSINSVEEVQSVKGNKKHLEARKYFLEHHLDNVENLVLHSDEENLLVLSYVKYNRHCYVGFVGRRQKPNAFWHFNSEESFKNSLNEFIKINRVLQQQSRGSKDQSHDDVEIGDVFVSSWGYDQTNVDFYEVVGKRGKATVDLREIAQERNATSWAGGYCKPVRGAFIGEKFSKRVSGGRVKLSSFQSAGKVDIQVIAGVKIVPEYHYSHDR